MDAIVQTPSARSFAELSLAPAFTRQWPSIYSALADGSVDVEELRKLCLEQLPRQQSRLHFAIDVTAVRAKPSPTFKNRLYFPRAQREGGGQRIIIRLPDFILAYNKKP